MMEKLQLSLTAGPQQGAVTTIPFHFCGSQLHAGAVPRRVGTFGSMLRDWQHLRWSQKTMRRERRRQGEFTSPFPSPSSGGFFDLLRNNKRCFRSCPSLRNGVLLERRDARGDLNRSKKWCQFWNKSPPSVENQVLASCFLCVPF